MAPMTKEEIFAELKSMLIKLFEIDENKITPDAKIFEDLELDSIDAVDIVVMLQKKTGKKILPEQFKAVRTVQDIVDAIDKLLKEDLNK